MNKNGVNIGEKGNLSFELEAILESNSRDFIKNLIKSTPIVSSCDEFLKDKMEKVMKIDGISLGFLIKE